MLTSIIFLFVKHPFDVGDRINILKDSYTVKEIRLLSTVFLDGQGCLVQAPNSILNTAVRPFIIVSLGHSLTCTTSISKTSVAVVRCLRHLLLRSPTEPRSNSWKLFVTKCSYSWKLKGGTIYHHLMSWSLVCLISPFPPKVLALHWHHFRFPWSREHVSQSWYQVQEQLATRAFKRFVETWESFLDIRNLPSRFLQPLVGINGFVLSRRPLPTLRFTVPKAIRRCLPLLIVLQWCPGRMYWMKRSKRRRSVPLPIYP